MQWKTIDRAPKDGTEILCWRQGWEKPVLLAWSENPRIVSAHAAGNHLSLAAAYFGDPNELDDYEFAAPDGGPTHWLPLPPFPGEPTGELTAEEREREALRRINEPLNRCFPPKGSFK